MTEVSTAAVFVRFSNKPSPFSNKFAGSHPLRIFCWRGSRSWWCDLLCDIGWLCVHHCTITKEKKKIQIGFVSNCSGLLTNCLAIVQDYLAAGTTSTALRGSHREVESTGIFTLKSIYLVVIRAALARASSRPNLSDRLPARLESSLLIMKLSWSSFCSASTSLIGRNIPTAFVAKVRKLSITDSAVVVPNSLFLFPGWNQHGELLAENWNVRSGAGQNTAQLLVRLLGSWLCS